MSIYLVNRFYFQVVRPFDSVAKLGNQNDGKIFISEDKELRHAILSKVKPWLGQAIDKFIIKLKNNVINPRECIQDSSLTSDAIRKRFNEVNQTRDAIIKNEFLQNEFPQVRGVIEALDEFLSRK